MPRDDRTDMWDAVLWYRVPLFIGALSILLIVLSITIFIKTYQNQDPIRFTSDEEIQEKSERQEILVVDIRGAVMNPGVYELPLGMRVEDALVRAGGLTEDADLFRMEQVMNRAAKLADGAKLYVPRLDDPTDVPHIPEEISVSGMNLNTASSSELESLPGVGPVIAAKIIAGRPYQRLEELVEKNIVGQSLFSKIHASLTL